MAPFLVCNGPSQFGEVGRFPRRKSKKVTNKENNAKARESARAHEVDSNLGDPSKDSWG